MFGISTKIILIERTAGFVCGTHQIDGTRLGCASLPAASPYIFSIERQRKQQETDKGRYKNHPKKKGKQNIFIVTSCDRFRVDFLAV
jgi:hypothetical protein